MEKRDMFLQGMLKCAYLADPIEDGLVSHESVGAIASGHHNDVGTGHFVESGGGLDGQHAPIGLVKPLSMAHKHHIHVGQDVQWLVWSYKVQCGHILENGDGHLQNAWGARRLHF